MKKTCIRTGVTAASLAAATAIGAVPSVAAAYPTQARITAGAQPAGTAITFTAVNSNVFVLRDLRSGVHFACPTGSVVLTGSANVGSSSNNPFARITSSMFTGCKLSNLSLGISQLQAWNLRASNPSTPTAGPSSGQTTPVEVNGVLAKLALGNSGSTCDMALGDGVPVANGTTGAPGVVDGSGGAFGVKYVNANPSSLQVQTTSNPSMARLGINSTPIDQGCAAGTMKKGDKMQMFGLSSSTSTAEIVATFSVTARTTGGAAANPFWVAAP